MIRKILKKDLHRNKIITISLFLFIMLSAMLCASSMSIFAKLSTSIDSFFEYSAVPDFVQMHAGEYKQTDIDAFTSKHQNIIQDQQTITLLNIKGANIFMHQKQESEENSIMDAAFVKQNKKFDFLINDNNEAVNVHQGEIAIPIYYQQRDDLKINDKVYVTSGKHIKEFKIVDFIKDSQMNASIISSKRLLVNEKDYDDLEAYAQKEYLIEFLSNDVSALEIVYQNSDMPHNGTTITKGLLYVLNALMDGIIAAILLVISFLLMGISFLCLRFTILMTLEEDVKEIGIMKAIGIAKGDIQKLYMGKYIAITIVGCICGYLGSIAIQNIIFKNIQLYMGSGDTSNMIYAIPLLALIILGSLILGFAYMMLNRMHRITPLQALHNDIVRNRKQKTHVFTLHKHHIMPVSLLLSIQDVWTRKRLYISVCFIIALSSFLMIVPCNLKSTMDSKSFIRYMGIGNADLRMDILQDEDMIQTYEKVEKGLKQDPTIVSYSAYTTYKIDMLNVEGEWENLQVERGDFTKFPLTYLQGTAPCKNDEIAISYAISNEQKLKVHDILQIKTGDSVMNMKVKGIYQDITNGGKSAKVKIPLSKAKPMRTMININVRKGVNIANKQNEYSKQYDGIKITDTQGYISQTLSGLNNQVQNVVEVALFIAFLITIFQISLFLKMLLKKDERENTIMKSIGFNDEQIQRQYIQRMLIVVLLGIIIGTFSANIGGEYLLGLCMKSMGITRLQFVIVPWMTYFILPLMLISAAGIATVIATRNIKKLHIADITIE